MGRRGIQKKNTAALLENKELGSTYLKSLDEDNQYRIEVDPDNFYGMSDKQKKFISLYVEYRNLAIVTELMDLEFSEVKEYFTMYSTQQEIRRISTALYHRQVASNIMKFEDIGAYLTGWLVGTEVPEAERLKNNEKLTVIKMLMEWHKLSKEFIEKPENITVEVIEEELEQLSVATIKQMISTKSMLNNKGTKTTNSTKKEDIINQLSDEVELSKEEVEYLESLTIKELLEILKD